MTTAAASRKFRSLWITALSAALVLGASTGLAAAPNRLHTLRGHTQFVTCVVFSPDGKIVASGSHDSSVKLWDPQRGESLATLLGHTSAVYALAFHPGGKILASGALDNSIKLWDVVQKKNLATLQGHTALIRSLSFSPDGRTLASAGLTDMSVIIWDVSEFAGKTANAPGGRR